MQVSSSVRSQVGFQLGHVYLRLVLDALLDFPVTGVDKVEKVLHTRDSRLAVLLNCVEHVFPIRASASASTNCQKYDFASDRTNCLRCDAKNFSKRASC